MAFPGDTPPAAAREYLVRELGEVTCEPRSRRRPWEETAAGPVLRFGPPDTAPAFAEIGPGVREELAGLQTRAVHFPADWPLDRAGRGRPSTSATGPAGGWPNSPTRTGPAPGSPAG